MNLGKSCKLKVRHETGAFVRNNVKFGKDAHIQVHSKVMDIHTFLDRITRMVVDSIPVKVDDNGN